jgi:hypothetical protein
MVMEMMDMEAASRIFTNYTHILAGSRKNTLQMVSQIYADAEINAHVDLLRQGFKELVRKALINRILLAEEMTRQIPLLLNFLGDLAKLQNSLNSFDAEMNEAYKALEQIDPNSASASHASGTTSPPIAP